MDKVLNCSQCVHGGHDTFRCTIRIGLRDNGLIDSCFKDPPWHLDTHSTILSRKHSYHKKVGKLMYVKTKYERKS